MDLLRFDGQKGPIRALPSVVSCRIDTWQIVYLSSKEACPTISIHKSETKVP